MILAHPVGDLGRPGPIFFYISSGQYGFNIRWTRISEKEGGMIGEWRLDVKKGTKRTPTEQGMAVFVLGVLLPFILGGIFGWINGPAMGGDWFIIFALVNGLYIGLVIGLVVGRGIGLVHYLYINMVIGLVIGFFIGSLIISIIILVVGLVIRFFIGLLIISIMVLVISLFIGWDFGRVRYHPIPFRLLFRGQFGYGIGWGIGWVIGLVIDGGIDLVFPGHVPVFLVWVISESVGITICSLFIGHGINRQYKQRHLLRAEMV
jgi:hypothetical protein